MSLPTQATEALKSGKNSKAKHPDVMWHIAMMPGKRKAMDKNFRHAEFL
jgi:hypothetical protein